MLAFRAAVATTIPIVALIVFGAFAVYSFYVEQKLITFRLGEKITKENRWNAALYPEEAAKWIARDRMLHRLRTVVWLGLIFVANALYSLIKP